jgi:hypothetical protein
LCFLSAFDHNPSSSASQVAEITGIHNHACLCLFCVQPAMLAQRPE